MHITREVGTDGQTTRAQGEASDGVSELNLADRVSIDK